MFWQRVIREGERMPRGWGVGWAGVGRDREPWVFFHVCYPVPLNLIFRWCHGFYWCMARPRRRDLVWRVYSRVYRHEHKKAYDWGYEKGYTAGHQDGRNYREHLLEVVETLKEKED